MPIVPFIPAIIGAGVGLYGAAQGKKAAKESLAAETAASDKSLAAQQHALDVSLGVNQRFLNGGGAAFDALLSEYGLGPQNPGGNTGGNAGVSPLPDPNKGVNGAYPGDPGYDPTGGSRSGYPAGNGSPMGAMPSAPSYDAYLQANPDLAAEAQRVTASGQFPSVGAYLQWHDQNYPQENRPSSADPAAPQAPQTPGQPQAPTPSGPTAANPATDLLNAPRPDAGPAPTFTRPDGGTAPSFARPTDQAQPTFGAAPQFSNYFNPNDFTQDPSYQFRLKQGLDNTNTNFAARGLLKSSAAAKGITDYASNLASQEYGNAFSRAQSLYNNDLSQYNNNRNFAEQNYQYGQNRQDTNFGQDRTYGTNLFLNQQGRADDNFNTDRGVGLTQYNTDRTRTDTNFNNDRNYQTNRYDTRIGNLFDLARIGTTAASNVSGATAANANAETSIYGSHANAVADAANRRASANASGVGALGAAAGNVFAAYGGGGGQPSGRASADPYSNYGF